MPEPDIRVFRNGDQTVWADMSTLQGIGVLPDGTYINTTEDEYADTLYEIIRAEHDGEISAKEAYRRKEALAQTIADRKYPSDPEKRKEYYYDRLSVFASRDIHYYDIPDITGWLDLQMKTAEYEVPELISQPYFTINNKPIRIELASFKDLFTDGGKYDLKEWPEVKSYSLFIYNGEIVSRDALANILYGYVGKACGISEYLLKIGAGANQIKKSGINFDTIRSFGDDRRDLDRIEQGFELYLQKHG